MIRSKHVVIGTFGLMLLAIYCLGMLASQCPGCGYSWLSSIAAGALGLATMASLTLCMLSLWRTHSLWHICHAARVPHPPKLQRVCRQLGLAGERVVCTARTEPLAFCIGLLQPRVVVSTGLLEQVSSQELSAILAHERQHQQRRDPLRLLVVTLLRTFLYPLPVVHDLSRTFVALMEIEADEAAIAWSGRPVLASALYKLLALSTPKASPQFALVTPFGVQGRRLACLLDPHHTEPLPLPVPRLVISLTPFLLICLTMVFS